jgi:hypothetical protein
VTLKNQAPPYHRGCSEPLEANVCESHERSGT